MVYGSVCSGISSESVAWKPTLGWSPAWFSEIAEFPAAVLAHRYPGTPNLGDANKIHEKPEFKQRKIDVLVGGTPCQSLSGQGPRTGFTDPRGKLALRFLEIAEMRRPRWLLWENVEAALCANGGRDFAAMLAKLGKIGYGYSWHVLDARDFGLAQSRRRVFLVGRLGDWQRAAAVFSDHEGMLAAAGADRGEAAQGRGTGPEGAGTVAKAYALQGNDIHRRAEAGRGMALREDLMYALTVSDKHAVIAIRGNTIDRYPETERLGIGCREGPSYCLTASARHAVLANGVARYILPVEAERLQGLPDDYTKVPYRGRSAEQCPDQLRYEAVGNAMPVPILQWLGKRMAFVDSLPDQRVKHFLPAEDFARTLTDAELIEKCVQGFCKLKEIVPYLREARERFAQQGRRVPVPGKPTWREWIEQNLGVTVRRVNQLLRMPEPEADGSQLREKISRGSKRLAVGDWRGLLKATESRLVRVFGPLEDQKELAEAVRRFAQAIADRFTERHGKLVVSVSVESHK